MRPQVFFVFLFSPITPTANNIHTLARTHTCACKLGLERVKIQGDFGARKMGTLHALHKLIKSNATLANMFQIIASECCGEKKGKWWQMIH